MAKATQQFDYIIIGAGCSGLSLAMRMLSNSFFDNKKILLIDKYLNVAINKTWCFWDKGNISNFWNGKEHIYHTWDKLSIVHPKGEIPLTIAPYAYKMIRGKEFTEYCLQQIAAADNITLKQEEVVSMDAASGSVSTEKINYYAQQLFSSVLIDVPVMKANDIYLLQHFTGWWIETETDVFNPASAQLMNFKTSQDNGCTFFYVLPVSKRRALVEYTLFSEELLQPQDYDIALKIFIDEELGITSYEIIQREKGAIPMTTIAFPQQKDKIFFIGTSGGQTKASTGYTFAFIQKQSDQIINDLINFGKPKTHKPSTRFNFYDRVLLQLLAEKKYSGAEIFYNMFLSNKATDVLAFLDNETNFLTELKIMNSTNKKAFLPAALKSLKR